MERRAPVTWSRPDELDPLWPDDVDGNALNGVGEAEVRAPTQVMWTDPGTIAHGSIQVYMGMAAVDEPDVLAAAFYEPPAPGELSDTVEQRTPDEWVRAIEEFVTTEAEHRVELVGFARLRPEWIFTGQDPTHVPAETGRAREFDWMVVLGVEMDHGRLATAPEPTAAVEVLDQYRRGTLAAAELAVWLRARGHDAHGHGGPDGGPVLMIPAAIEAGFGELGKHGSIINRTYGSSFRLACVLTSVPLVAGRPDVFGASDFCEGCRVCTDACPPGAISPDQRLVRGVDKWYVDFDRCLPYFATTHGCAICLAVCPWSKPGASPRLAETMTRKRARRAAGAG